jgi:class IV lanthipeptide synthase
MQDLTLKKLVRWRELCKRFLPEAQAGSIWRYHRRPCKHDAQQGWKLHISATVLNAHNVLARIAPFLESTGVQFKAPGSLIEVKRLNSGIHYAYAQIGKIITVYPRSEREAALIAHEIHELTRHLTAPAVPFDQRYKSGSNVYYRYGAFRALEMDLPNGQRVVAVKDPKGRLQPDCYSADSSAPAWVSNPFPKRRARKHQNNPLRSTYKVLRALSQRGKGGVYQAIDFSVTPPRFCLIKEGRRVGDVSWDGRDGSWRVKHEHHVLTQLRQQGLDVPIVYSSFELAGNYYLVTEFIEGEDVDTYLSKRKRRLSFSKVVNYGLQLSKLINGIHNIGWVWRDCKPNNLLLTRHGFLRAVDFEGACSIDNPDPMAWVSPAFTRPLAERKQVQPAVWDDLFAVGTMLYLLVTGRMPTRYPSPQSIRQLRRNAPHSFCELISELLNPQASLNVAAVVGQLRALQEF